jgi:hypothetical protein
MARARRRKREGERERRRGREGDSGSIRTRWQSCGWMIHQLQRGVRVMLTLASSSLVSVTYSYPSLSAALSSLEYISSSIRFHPSPRFCSVDTESDSLGSKISTPRSLIPNPPLSLRGFSGRRPAPRPCPMQQHICSARCPSSPALEIEIPGRIPVPAPPPLAPPARARTRSGTDHTTMGLLLILPACPLGQSPPIEILQRQGVETCSGSPFADSRVNGLVLP